ncbi:hypothetical protein K0M31_012723 [Melipona bicolor]|uniref:Uncharacterized protein n=1 Tax=Melipona bicolor TaxID=60889 RepID=A0AA40FJ16_9HYME|nr:hypothetical protein K0M31_012723 [Melipona bicolor]
MTRIRKHILDLIPSLLEARSNDISRNVAPAPPRYGSELVAEFGSHLWNLVEEEPRLVAPELLPRTPTQFSNLCPSTMIPSTAWKFSSLAGECSAGYWPLVRYPNEFRPIAGFQ